MANDNWGWRARIGVFIVGNEAIPEAEWWAMVPPGVSVHAARVTARAPWARWREDRKAVINEEKCVGCGECVSACPVPGCMNFGLGWGKRFHTLPALFPVVGMLFAVFLFYFWASASGHWHNNLPLEMIRRDHLEIRSMQHP